MALLMTPEFSPAQFAIAAFFKHRVSALAFTTATKTLQTWNCSSLVTVQSRNASGIATNVASDTTLNLSGTGSLTFYDDATCTNTITSVKILAGQNSASFYLLESAVGSPVATAAAAGFQSASQTQTVSISAFIWMGGAGNANWSTAANWSGGTAPGNNDLAVFTSACMSNCSPTIAANPNVGGIRMVSGYAGTLTQSAGVDMNIGAKGWTQFAGTFTGGVDTVDISGMVVLAGGTYTATKGTTRLNYQTPGMTIQNALTFDNNSGTLQIDICSHPTITPANIVLNNLIISNGCNWSGSVLNGTLTVLGTMTVAGSSYQGGFGSGGIINLSGNLVNNSSSWGLAADCWLRLVGTAGSNISVVGNTGPLGSMEIASLGTVNFSNDIDVGGNFKYTSGTIAIGTSNFHLGSSYVAGKYIDPAGMRFYDVTMGQGAYSNGTIVSTVYVDHNLNLAGWDGRSGFSGASFEVLGNVAATNGGNSGTVPVLFKGASGQTLSATVNSNFYNGAFTINTSGGAIVTMASAIDWTASAQTLTITSGGLNMAGYDLSVKGLTLNGNTMTRAGGVLKVNGFVVGAGVQSVYGGTVNP